MDFSWELGLVFTPVLKWPKSARGGLSPYPPSAGVNKSLCSDTESLGGSCESRSLDSPNSSPGETRRNSCLISPPKPKTGIKPTLTHSVHRGDDNSSLYFLSSQGNSNRKLLKAPSTSTMSSSDDFEERDSLQTFENGEPPHTFLSHKVETVLTCRFLFTL